MAVRPYSLPGSPISFNTYTPDFIGKPVQQIGNSLLNTNRADNMLVNKLNKLDIALSNLNVNPIDNQYLVEQKQKFNDSIKNIANSGNFNTASGILNKTYNEYATNQGLKNAITRNAEYMQQRAKVNADRTKYSERAYNYLMNVPFTKTVADSNGFYSPFSLPQLMQKYDYAKELHAIGSNAPKLTKTNQPTIEYGTNGKVLGYSVNTQKYKDTTAIYNDMYNAALANTNTVAYAQQEAQLRNHDGSYLIDKNGNKQPWSVDDVLHSWIKPLAESYGGTSNTTSYNYNQKALEGLGIKSKADYIPVISNNNTLNNVDRILGGIMNKDSRFNNVTDAAKTFGYASAYSGYSKYGTINNNKNSSDVLHIINQNLKNANLMESQTIGNISNSIAQSKYNIPFDKLNASQKVDIYREAGKYIKDKLNNDNTDNQISNVSYTTLNNNPDERKSLLNLFTSNKNGLIIDSKGNLLLNQGITSHEVYDVDAGKFIKGKEFYDKVRKFPDNTRLSITGKTDYTSPLTSLSSNAGFGDGTVIDVSDDKTSHRYIVAGSKNNVASYNNYVQGLLYSARNSIAKGGTYMFPIGVPTHPIDGKTLYMSIDNPNDTNSGNQIPISTAKTLYYLDNNGDVVNSKTFTNHSDLVRAILRNSNLMK